MGFYETFYIFIMGWPFGFLLAWIWSSLEKRIMIKKTKLEGGHILQEAQEKADALLEKCQKEAQSTREKTWRIFEREKEQIKAHIKTLQAVADKKSQQLALKHREKSALFSALKKTAHHIQREHAHYKKQKSQLRLDLKQHDQDSAQKIKSHFSINAEKLREELKKEIEDSWTDKIREEWEAKSKHSKQNLQKDSVFLLNKALSRFDRVYCPERGIRAVPFKTDKQMERAFGPDNVYLNEIEKECGVDILLNKEDSQASVFGIDPVRRELGRVTLKKLLKKRKIDLPSIKKAVQRSKKDLFAKIRRDGQAICKRLRLKNVAPEAQNMMGALRYRYSFAQNQHFHCEEAGWLCGLLSAELSLPVKPAQRAGMFHDIGKAMDHSIEGNHAVIGAEFLSKHGEREEILHAVRAHHHDVQPSTALAYLVIVADSISGSRPGARRFTEDSYSQKMASLERIIDSFENIEDAYIMSAGREMRVIADNKKVSDQEALELSQKIARKIEKECAYPGLIKVTVVLHSEKTAIA